MENILTIYHGSKDKIIQPIYGLGKNYNDYGQGFYCTEILELAKEWACTENLEGYANQYQLDMRNLSVLNLTKDYHILNWLAILLENRSFELNNNELMVQAKQYILDTFLPDYRNYDVIIGYRADDSYFQFAKDFIQGTISLKTLGEAMRLGKLGEQIVLKSEKAFQTIKFVGYEKVDHKEYFSKRAQRDNKARSEYRKYLKNKKFDKNDIYIIDILREEMKNDDQRLQ